jgi:hypothetical protein
MGKGWTWWKPMHGHEAGSSAAKKITRIHISVTVEMVC